MNKLAPWLGVQLILIIIFGTMYGVAQQAQRLDGNNPQIQLAEDAASALNHGIKPDYLVAGLVDPRTSLAPFLVIYDTKGQPVVGSGYLNAHLPVAPIGILEAAKGHDYHAITWQPKADVRIAAVTVAANNYYVLSGRSLREVEHNESRSFELALLGGVIATTALAVTYLASRRLLD